LSEARFEIACQLLRDTQTTIGNRADEVDEHYGQN
jgi:hypothetical protein